MVPDEVILECARKGGVIGIESSKNIIRNLVKLGSSDEDTAKIIGGNVLRVLREIWEN